MEPLIQLAFEYAPVGLVVTRYRFIHACSPSFASMFGYKPQELIGQSLAVLHSTVEEFDNVGRLWLRGMSQSLQYSDNRIMKRRDGTQFWCQVHGRSTTPGDLLAQCVSVAIDLSHHRPVVRLTRREREIAMLIVEGLTNKEIARRLEVSPRTIEAHRSRMMHKFNARTSAEMYAKLAGLPA
jgi:PAS domain S-box-containing protein